MPPEENTTSSEDPQNRGLGKAIPTSYATYVDRWAIVVGISKYKHESLNLKYADRDAEEVYKLLLSPLGGNFKSDRVIKLTNQEATTAKITQALRSFLKKPAREDLVVIYFACHGSPDFDRPGNVYMLTHDTNPNDIAGTALPMREIDLSLKENLLAERVIVLADTCHSAAIGGGMGRRNTNDNAKLVNRYLREVSTARGGIALLTSAEANEVSFEDIRWGGGHGVFTYYLLKGMQGEADTNKNGFVTVGELFEYVRAKVQEDTEYRQHPSIGTNPYDRNFPLAIAFSNARNTEPSKPKNQPDNSSQDSSWIEPKPPRNDSKMIAILALILTLMTLAITLIMNLPRQIDQPIDPTGTSTVTIPSLPTASENEKAGFEAILAGNLRKARSYFGYAYAKYPTYHNVDEIYHQLLSEEKVNAYNNSSQSQKQIILKQVFQAIVDKYSWGVPDDVLARIKSRL